MKEGQPVTEIEYNRSFVLAAIICLFCLSIPTLLYVVPDYDFWWHLKSGTEIYTSGQLHSTDPFSFTAGSQPWINHEWLSQLVYAIGYDHFFFNGVLFVRAIVLLSLITSFYLLLVRLSKNPGFSLLLLVLFAIHLIFYFANLRPRIFTFLFLVVFLHIVETCRSKIDYRILCMPFSLLVWQQLHGGFILGFLFMLFALISLFYDADGSGRSLSKREKNWLLITFIVILLVPIINPYGSKMFSYLITELGRRPEGISEWRALAGSQWTAFLFILIPTLITSFFCRAWQRRTLFTLFIFCSTAVLFSNRHFPLFVIVASCLFMSGFTDVYKRYLEDYPFKWLKRSQSVCLPLALSLIFVLMALPAIFRFKTMQGQPLMPVGKFPVKAVDFLKNNYKSKTAVRLANYYDWGGYLIWQLYPDYLVSADSRFVTVYPQDVIENQIKSYKKGEAEEFVAQINPDLILIESNSILAGQLNKMPQWQNIYSDSTATIFDKR